MSRVPRAQEHLKTGFSSEAAAAARYRASARSAAAEGRPELARRWIELAEAKDELAAILLEAAGQVRPPERALADALAEERYENDVLYPKMIRDVRDDAEGVFRQVIAAQQEHVERLEKLRAEVRSAAGGDLG